MTPRAFIAARTRLGWSRHRLATAIGTDEKQIRRWEAASHLIPADLEAWLAKATAWLRANPPPKIRKRVRAAAEPDAHSEGRSATDAPGSPTAPADAPRRAGRRRSA